MDRPITAADAQTAQPKPKTDEVLVSFRHDRDEVQAWQTVIKASGMRSKDFYTNAIREYIRRHYLSK